MADGDGSKQAKVLQAVERRMKAQNDIGHYKKKYTDEEAKVKEAKGVAEVVEEEFEVGLFFFVLLCS